MVVTGRVTDASLVVGPAVAHFGWSATAYDELAGAVVAGHVLECGTQATGGNFSGFRTLDRSRPLGFPVAEISADGSSVITKHDGTGGAVTVDTVTAQLVYEIQSTRYLGPDVTTLLDTVRLSQAGPDRVAISGVRGEAPPARLKVCVNALGGFRNSVELVLTGLDIEEKADWARAQLTDALAAAPPAETTWTLSALPAPDADSEEEASCLLRCMVTDPSPDPVGKAFTAATVELALASYPGLHDDPAARAGDAVRRLPSGVRRPRRGRPHGRARGRAPGDGRRPRHLHRAGAAGRARPAPLAVPRAARRAHPPAAARHLRARPLRRQGRRRQPRAVGVPRGLDADHRDALYDARCTWLAKLASPSRIRTLLPETADLDVEVYLLPNLGAVNVVIHGLLGQGVAASTRFDPQAKGLGEWARSRMVAIEESLL